MPTEHDPSRLSPAAAQVPADPCRSFHIRLASVSGLPPEHLAIPAARPLLEEPMARPNHVISGADDFQTPGQVPSAGRPIPALQSFLAFRAPASGPAHAVFRGLLGAFDPCR